MLKNSEDTTFSEEFIDLFIQTFNAYLLKNKRPRVVLQIVSEVFPLIICEMIKREVSWKVNRLSFEQKKEYMIVRLEKLEEIIS